MKAQPILLGVAIAGIAVSVGYLAVNEQAPSSFDGSGPTAIATDAVPESSSAADGAVTDETNASPESAAQSDGTLDSPSAIASSQGAAQAGASKPQFDASTGDNSVAALPSCTDAVTQTDMNICAHQSYEAVDVELNQTYQALTQALNAPEQELLTDAELAWIEYRDKTCELEAAPYEGGTIQPLIYSQCLTRMTENRTAELQAHLNEISSR